MQPQKDEDKLESQSIETSSAIEDIKQEGRKPGEKQRCGALNKKE